MKAKRNLALGICAPALVSSLAMLKLAPAPNLAEPPASGIERVQDRLELRSYEPYATLQFGFRPEPPSPPRGVRKVRPEIVQPTAVAPLMRPNVPEPFSAAWYRYCARTYRSFEPGTGLYTTYSGTKRLCH